MKRFLSMAALALAGAIMAACSGSDDGIDTPPQPENTGKVITLKTTVGLGGGAADETTRALTAGGVKTFAVGETMALGYYKYDSNTQTTSAVSEPLTADDIAEDGKSATFTFRLTEAPNKSQPVKYIYPAAMATNSNVNYNRLDSQQDGTLTKLASDFDVATANDLAWVGDNLPGATLKNLLAILAITLKDDVTGADITSSITSLILSVGSYTYNVSRSAGDGPIYVAIRRTATEDHHSGSNINVTASDGIFTYTKTLQQKKYYTGNFYNVGWRMTNTMQSVPLTMEALTAGTIVVDKPREGMQYSKNSGAKTAVTSDAISVSAGDKVQFYGNSATYYSGSSDYTSITGSGDGFKCKVYGNIMSLVDETGYADATTLTSENTFRWLFYGNDKLKDASGLLLPATTLTESCYYGMFSGCTSLETAPALPATTLITGCYYSMFFGCTSLETAPALPAEELAQFCYTSMFSGCSSLTAAPALPATTLAQGCYQFMFENCTSLTAAPALPATTLTSNCYNGMFDGCTSLETAPALPAKMLAYYCYQRMFSGCTNLKSVTCLATKISADGCTSSWLVGAGTQVTGTKTFTTPSKTNWSTGTSGIPDGWTRVDY